jgi:hypothetical protein
LRTSSSIRADEGRGAAAGQLATFGAALGQALPNHCGKLMPSPLIALAERMLSIIRSKFLPVGAYLSGGDVKSPLILCMGITILIGIGSSFMCAAQSQNATDAEIQRLEERVRNADARIQEIDRWEHNDQVNARQLAIDGRLNEPGATAAAAAQAGTRELHRQQGQRARAERAAAAADLQRARTVRESETRLRENTAIQQQMNRELDVKREQIAAQGRVLQAAREREATVRAEQAAQLRVREAALRARETKLSADQEKLRAAEKSVEVLKERYRQLDAALARSQKEVAALSNGGQKGGEHARSGTVLEHNRPTKDDFQRAEQFEKYSKDRNTASVK